MSLTLLQIGEAVLRILNDHQASFWTHDDLKVYAQMAFQGFQRMAVRRDPKFGMSEFELTYRAGQFSGEAPLTRLDPASITSVIDLGEQFEYEWADSLQEIQDLQANSTTMYSGQSRVFIDRVGDNLRMHIGPVPGTEREIRINFQQTPENFISHNSMRTGLPDPYEKCIILEVIRLARMQEQNLELVQATSALLREAKIDVARYIRSLKRGSKRVRYDEEDYQ